jgi:hypothetical protein
VRGLAWFGWMVVVVLRSHEEKIKYWIAIFYHIVRNPIILQVFLAVWLFFFTHVSRGRKMRGIEWIDGSSSFIITMVLHFIIDIIVILSSI